MKKNRWNLESWKEYPINQHPGWFDENIINPAVSKINKNPPLVFKNEILLLKNRLASAYNNQYYIIQGGDCAETFTDFNASLIKNKLNILLQMSVVLSYGTSKKTIRIGRIAGQFAKPRTSPIEIVNDIEYPSYRGDAVNSFNLSLNSRQPDPNRMLKAYEQSAYTLNLIRSIINQGYTNIYNANEWDLDFIKKSSQGKKYQKIITEIQKALKFIKTIGSNMKKDPRLELNEFFTSHEGLLLEYEQALTRYDASNKKYYNHSAHMIWIGDRTRQLNGAHLEFASGIENPIGIKIGPTIDKDELVEIINKVNPNNEVGKIILITRLGLDKIEHTLPDLMKNVHKNKLHVIWLCDPMHGNTYNNKYGYKTRHFDTIIKELEIYMNIHGKQKSHPGGIHIEFTSEDVTECLGGYQNINDETLHNRYETACDPRLNNQQSLELIFKLTELINRWSKNA
tara:strand:+ start:333 stop:1694 length:1362 start_codon:yes stop_codon:yes gene_type:complete